MQKTYCVRVTIEGNTLSDCDRASAFLVDRSNAWSPTQMGIHGKCTNYELVPEQPKESMSVAAFGVAVIGGLGFLVGLMF